MQQEFGINEVLIKASFHYRKMLTKAGKDVGPKPYFRSLVDDK